MRPLAARADRLEHARIGKRGGITFALQLKPLVIDAARHVGCEHQQKIDFLGGQCGRRDQRMAEEDQSQEGSERAHRASVGAENGGNPAGAGATQTEATNSDRRLTATVCSPPSMRGHAA